MLDQFYLRRGRHARWRVLTAMISVLAFLALLASASAHHHATRVDSRACAVCDAVGNVFTGHQQAPTVGMVLVLMPYRTSASPGHAGEYYKPRILPPGRGPPSCA